MLDVLEGLLVVGILPRTFRSWHVLAEAFVLLSRGRRTRCDGLYHEIYPSCHCVPHNRRLNIFHDGVAARCGVGKWNRPLVLDTRGADGRILPFWRSRLLLGWPKRAAQHNLWSQQTNMLE